MRTLRLALAMTLCGTAPAVSRAADLPPARQAIEAVIDEQIDANLKANGVTPAAQADDFTLVRRLTLDLVGRIPTLPEVEAYTRSADPNKRTTLVDGLLASPGYARSQAAQFEAMLGHANGRSRGSAAFSDYLTAAMAENRPWNQIFRELLLPDAKNTKLQGAAEFLRPRLNDTDRLTNDVSVVFFGVNVSCAQCHDHPLVKDWTQDHYFGMKSFLARSFEKNGIIGEQPSGVIKFKPNKGPEKAARLMFLTGTVVDDPTPVKEPAKAAKSKTPDKADTTPPPVPAFSAREQLVNVALRPENAGLFSRSIVNRLWDRFLGYGLVTPLDQMHSENPPSHPVLLDWLARDTAAHGYDLKRLVRGIVLSKTYSRASKTDSESAPEAHDFAVARLKPLTPIQLATSLKVAAHDPAGFAKLSPTQLDKKMSGFERASRGLTNMIAQPTPDNFQIGVSEALLFSNGEMIMKDYLGDGRDSLLGRLKGEAKPAAGVSLLVRTMLGRAPTPREQEALTAFLARRTSNPAEAYRQAMWALATCPEFRFNH